MQAGGDLVLAAYGSDFFDHRDHLGFFAVKPWGQTPRLGAEGQISRANINTV